MAYYDYQCDVCKHEEALMMSVHEYRPDVEVPCPKCAERGIVSLMQRVLSTARVVLLGGDWGGGRTDIGS